MARLLLLPQQKAVYPQQQRFASEEQLSFSLPGWVSELLKFAGTPYRENPLLERLAVQKALWTEAAAERLQYLVPLAGFKGTSEDLHWLFQELSLGLVQLSQLPEAARTDVQLLYTLYQEWLQQWQVMDQGQQAQSAVKGVAAWCHAHNVEEVCLWGTLPQVPVYESLLQVAGQERKITTVQSPKMGSIIAQEYATMQVEIEATALQVRDLLATGKSPETIALALADGQAYLPLLQKVWERYRLPWTNSNITLAQQPFGRAVQALLRLLQGNWTSKAWQACVQPGWGWPWLLESEDRNLLDRAPWLKGYVQWREFLGCKQNWQVVLREVEQWLAGLQTCTTLADYANWLRQILQSYPPQVWGSQDELQWAQLLKGWDGLHAILDALDHPDIEVSIGQFSQVLLPALERYRVPGAKQFHQQITVGSLEQLAALEFDQIFVLGMTEAAFPRRVASHWLAGLPNQTPAEQVWHQALSAAPKLTVSWPLEDAGGRAHLPSPILRPSLEQKQTPKLYMDFSQPVQPLHFSNGKLAGEEARNFVISQLTTKPQSISRLNRFLACPYQYFCQEVLGLAEQDEFSEDATALEEGSAVHGILQEFWKQFASERPPRGLALTTWLRQAMVRQEEHLGQRLPERVLAELQSFLAYDIESLPAGYKPQFLEHAFHDLKIHVNGVTIELRGVIDRIDVNETAGQCVLLDYKTGKNPIPKEVREGVHLQLPVYYLALQQLRPDLDAVGIAFYSVREHKRAGLWCKPFHKDFDVSGNSANLFDADHWQQITLGFQSDLERALSRLLEGNFPIQPRTPQQCSYCPYNDICRLEVK